MDEKDSKAMQEVQFLKGHFYVDNENERLYQYIKRGMGGSGPKQYCFRILAQNGTQVSMSDKVILFNDENQLRRYRTKPTHLIEVPTDDLPLYIGWDTIFPGFEKALKER